GRLDYAAREGDVLGRFDYVVASVHSIFGLSQAAMTERILRALEDPHLTFLGHLTGRRLLERDGYAVGVEARGEAAAGRGVGLDDVHYGVTVARKGWLGVGNVVNAWGVEEVKAYFGKRRGGA